MQSHTGSTIRLIVEAIIEMIYSEMRICTANEDALLAKVADLIVDQYNCLMENFKKYQENLRCGMFSEQVCEAIYRTICGYFTKKDLENYKDKLTAPEEN